MSQEQIAEVEKARQQAQESAKKFEEVFQKTSEPEKPRGPIGPPPEARKHVKVPVERLEKKGSEGQVAGLKQFFNPTKKKQGRTLRDAIRDRYRPGSRAVKESRGAPLYTKRNPLESSGRISEELNPQKQMRLAHLREQIRAFQNRKELHSLEKVWRRTRAQRTHDPELRP